MIDNNGDDKELDLKRLAKAVGLVIVSLWIISLIVLGLLVDRGNEIGDSFGAVNALFSGLALTGIILTILMQREELKLQKRELELTRSEMEKTREEFEVQSNTMKIQQFENTFFQMISLFHGNIKTMAFNSDGERYAGTGVFALLLDGVERNLDIGLRNRYNQNNDKNYNDNPYDFFRDQEFQKVGKEEFIPLFLAHFSIYGDGLTKYFTTLYNVLKLIDKSEIIDKQYYVSIINSQLSRVERLTIFYYTISKKEDSNFRKLVENFNLLDGLSENMVVSKKIYKEYKPNLENKLLLA
ncbi:putative phage abortive infection protein [Chryseobacterium sp. KCF3-3]|uniref:putative phage abortive infection protein n=1 Tax=Chryseobacterium sp. KCF3-3 TaxID=3231511 RepID=UPI0038B3CC63